MPSISFPVHSRIEDILIKMENLQMSSISFPGHDYPQSISFQPHEKYYFNMLNLPVIENDLRLEAAMMRRGGQMRGSEWPLMTRLVSVSANLSTHWFSVNINIFIDIYVDVLSPYFFLGLFGRIKDIDKRLWSYPVVEFTILTDIQYWRSQLTKQ